MSCAIEVAASMKLQLERQQALRLTITSTGNNFTH